MNKKLHRLGSLKGIYLKHLNKWIKKKVEMNALADEKIAYYTQKKEEYEKKYEIAKALKYTAINKDITKSCLCER